MRHGSSTRSAILYLSYDGILEPLGESQVLSYLERLSVNYDIALISFEKPSDLNEESRLLKFKTRLEEVGIRWYPLRYHKTPPVLSTAYDIARAWWYAWRWQRSNQSGIAHARGYVAGLVALLVKQRGRIRFLFDMRGFWPEEKVEAGHWTNRSIAYRVTKWCERRFFERSDAIAEPHFRSPKTTPLPLLPGRAWRKAATLKVRIQSHTGRQRENIVLESHAAAHGDEEPQPYQDAVPREKTTRRTVSLPLLPWTSPFLWAARDRSWRRRRWRSSPRPSPRTSSSSLKSA